MPAPASKADPKKAAVASGAQKVRGRNRVTGNLSARSQPLAPPAAPPRIAMPTISRGELQVAVSANRIKKEKPRPSPSGAPWQGGYVIDTYRSRLESAPRYTTSDQPNWSDRAYTERVDDYWHVGRV